jgi:LuxR family quorum sensing-dependent transcriptional regulator
MTLEPACSSPVTSDGHFKDRNAAMLNSMPLDDTWRFVSQISDAADEQAIEKALVGVANSMGLVSIFGGIVPSLNASAQEIRNRILLQRFPNEWADRYNRRGYIYRDPIVERLQVDRTPFTWTDAYLSSDHADNVLLIEGESGEFGLRGGFVVPIALLDKCVAAISFGGSDDELSPNDQSMLSFLANYAVGAILQRRCSARRARGRISPREYDCLLWAAEGKTDWEIATILGISKPTVTKHILSAREKLGAVTKAHAIVIALRQNIIR